LCKSQNENIKKHLSLPDKTPKTDVIMTGKEVKKLEVNQGKLTQRVSELESIIKQVKKTTGEWRNQVRRTSGQAEKLKEENRLLRETLKKTPKVCGTVSQQPVKRHKYTE
jgi:septal ring factor EnvC (AmiA/AmiB activator)